MTDFASNCWFLSGPTAGGKTEIALHLAAQINAEIISMDSMAVYRRMDIGTAKPDAAQQLAVAHHLIDAAEPSEDYSLARYLDDASRAVEAILARDRNVLFVGGTPLYLKSLLRGIFEGPAADWEYRRELEQLATESEPGLLHRQLREVDPKAAAKLHPNDTRRLIRALEVHRVSGHAISELQQQFERGRSASECRVFVLDWPREVLYDRINRRVEAMFAAGLVQEVEQLLNELDPLSRTAAQAVGYREVIEHLQGERDLTATVELVKIRTRQFAKRQLTWFRSLSECEMVRVDEPLQSRIAADRIASAGLSRQIAARADGPEGTTGSA